MTYLNVLPTSKALPKDPILNSIETDGDGSTSCTLSHFREHAMVVELISSFASNNDSANNDYAGIEKICLILEIYQEQPFLLDSKLTQIITPITKVIAIEADAWIQSQFKGVNARLEKCFQLLYVLCKVRGYKTIERFLPHEIQDFQRIFRLFFGIAKKEVLSSWLMKYVILVWCSFLILLPFDIKRLEFTESFTSDVIGLADSFLQSSGKERDGASILLAKLITRTDICDRELPILLNRFEESMRSGKSGASAVFRLIGILKTMADILSASTREIMVRYAERMLQMTHDLSKSHPMFEQNSLLRKMCIKVIQRCGLVLLKPRRKQVFIKALRTLGENMIQKEKVKLYHEQESTQKKVINDDYSFDGEEEDEGDQDIDESLELIIESLLNSLQDKDTIVRWSAAKGIGRICARLPHSLSDQVIESMLAIVDFTFDGQEMVIEGGDCELVFETFDETGPSPNSWHGICLAVAEVIRRGLFEPKKLFQIIPLLVKALQYDIKSSIHSTTGQNVRDAACYVSWSIARAFSPQLLSTSIVISKLLIPQLVVTSIFDREIQCRRAASAAFQEWVGRVGADKVSHGIEIITIANYFSVGVRQHSYLEVAFEVASCASIYRKPLMDYLIHRQTVHWDEKVREEAALSLGKLGFLEPAYVLSDEIVTIFSDRIRDNGQSRISSSSSSMLEQHGAFHFFSAILEHVTDVEAVTQTMTKYVVPIFLEKDFHSSMYKDYGSASTLISICKWIGRYFSASSQICTSALVSKTKVFLLSMITESDSDLRRESAFAFKPFLAYLQGSNGKDCGMDGGYKFATEEWPRLLESAHEDMTKRAGYGLLLGSIPIKAVPDSLSFDKLVRAALAATCFKKASGSDNMTVEARCEAIKGLSVFLLENEFQAVATFMAHPEISQELFETFLTLMDDYSVDSRGDVGSWIREASVSNLLKIIQTFPTYKNGKCLTLFVGKLLQLSVEKLDRLRGVCMQALYTVIVVALMACEPAKENVPDMEVKGKNVLQGIFSPLRNSLDDLHDAQRVFSLLIPVLDVKEYRSFLLAGLVSSIGGLSETLVNAAKTSLFDHLRKESGESHEIFNDLMVLYLEKRENRWATAYLYMIDCLVNDRELGEKFKSDWCSLYIPRFLVSKALKRDSLSKDIKRLFAVIRILCDFISILSDSADYCQTMQYGDLRSVLESLTKFLRHPYPRVRHFAAEQLYLTLIAIELPGKEEFQLELSEYITEIDWLKWDSNARSSGKGNFTCGSEYLNHLFDSHEIQ